MNSKLLRILLVLLYFLTFAPSDDGWGIPVVAGSPKTDSLVSELQHAPDDSGKVDLLYAVSWYLKFSHPDSALSYARAGAELAQELTHTRGRAKSLKNQGDIHDIRGEYTEAINKYQEAIALFKQVSAKKFLSYTYMAMGLTYLHVGDFAEALKFNQKAIGIAREIGFQQNVPSCQTNIGIIHRHQQNYQRALQYHRQALEGFREQGNGRNIAKAFTNIGNIYKDLGDYQEAMNYFKKSLDKSRKLGIRRGVAISLGNIAQVHLADSSYTLALEHYNNSLELLKKLGNERRYAKVYNSIALVYNRMAHASENASQSRQLFEKSLTNALKARQLAESMESLPEQEGAYKLMSEAYAGLGDYRRAYKHQRSYQRARDSLFNKEKNRQVEELEAKYRLEQQEHENQLLKNKSRLQETRIKRANQVRNITIAGIILISLFSVFYYRRYKRQKQLTRELKQKNQYIGEQSARLNEMNRIKNQLISIISHDLKSPLSSIHTSAQALKDGYAKGRAEQEGFYDHIYKNSSSVVHLLENLLSWAKSHQDEVVYKPEKQMVYPVIQNNVEVLRPLAEDKQISFIVNIDDDSPEAVFDQNMISTAIRNLLSNAIKFTPRGGDVQVDLNEGAGFVEVAVSDTGKGMDESTKERIINGSVSGGEQGTENEGGSGIGLKVSREFIHKNGGQLDIESQPEKGSVFKFTLPKNSAR